MAHHSYQGEELDVFAQAVHWKSYLRSRVARWVRGDVLEVGAGIGGTTRFLCDGNQDSWVCLEPDPELSCRLSGAAEEDPFPVPLEVIVGGVADLAPGRRFDAILYVDVLEHIERDAEELEHALTHMKAGGALIVLSPAFQFLFSEFDGAVGHFRRYDKRSLTAVLPAGLERVALVYLDSLGMLTSLANRFLMRQSVPSENQIRFWDRWVLRASRLVDPLVLHSFGRSILAIYKKPAQTA